MRKLLSTVFLPSLIAIATPAQAAIYTATYTGHITSGEINQTAFGLAPGTDVVGMPYTATFTINDPPNCNCYQYSGDPSTSGIYGGYQTAPIGYEPSPVSAVFELNGVRLPIDGLYFGGVYKNYSPPQLGIYSANVETLADVSQGQVDLQLGQYIEIDSSLFSSPDFRKTGVYTASAASDSDSSSNSVVTADLLDDPNGNPVVGNPNLYFFHTQPDSVTIAQSGVPETSTWSMLLIGLGAVGTAKRGRRGAYGSLTA